MYILGIKQTIKARVKKIITKLYDERFELCILE